MSDTPMREMDLAEMLNELPKGHKAVTQFIELTGRLSREKDKVLELEQQANLTFDENAKFQIKGGQLIISIGFDGLKRSIEHDTDIVVTDNGQAIVAIKGVISREGGDGRTPFHEMIAAAAWQALEDGEMGLEEYEY